MLDAPLISPTMTVAELAALCASLSTEGCEVHVAVESIRGKPVGRLVRTVRNPESELTMLKRQAT